MTIPLKKVQEMLKINKRAPAHKWSHAEYLLTDKLFCGKCGSNMAGESGTSKTGAKHNYYICTRKKREKACDKKAIRQEKIEEIVLNATVDLVKDDATIDYIADCTWEYYRTQDFSRAEIEALQNELSHVETAIQNLMRAIEMGIINDATKKRMDELSVQQKDLTSAIADREISAGLCLTKEHIRFFLYQFQNKDYTDKECQKQLLKVFVNSIFLYLDHVVINFNYTNGTKTLPLTASEAGSETGTEFVCRTPCSI